MADMEIKVTHSSIYHRASRVPFSNYYECFGPDGTKFTNSSIVTLRSLLKRRYGKGTTITVVDRRSSDHMRMIRNGG